MRISLPTLAMVLLCCCGFWIGEESIDGRGLHLAAAWLVLAALACFQRLRSRNTAFGQPPRISDLAVVLLLAGHVFSTLHLEHIGGDLRSAWNLTMEWAGLSAAWYVLRAVCSAPHGRILLAETLFALSIGQAALGIWQHHVAFPRNAEWYQGCRAILDQAIQYREGAALQQAEEILTEFSRLGIPLEGPSRVLWENRALHSSEPLGTFALANTLSGILAAGLIHGIARWRTCGPRWPAKIALASSIVAVGYCLVLTKSRSAWLGAACGLLLLALQQQRSRSLRVLLRGSVVAVIGIVAIAGIAGFTGAVDREVILESPKSLQYRLLYWSGSLDMLAERPLFGAGPGNFRQAYLPHKADESSEEIRDPHNLLLEAWSSAGLPGLCGILLLLASLTTGLWSHSGIHSTGSEVSHEATIGGASISSRSRFFSGFQLAGCLLAAFGLDTAWEWFSADSLDGKLGDLFLLTGALAVSIRHRLSAGGLIMTTSAGLAAATAVGVHLFASGGFGISTVMLMLLTCMASGGLTGASDTRTSSFLTCYSLRRWCFAAEFLLIPAFVIAAGWVCLEGIRPLFLSDQALDLAVANSSRYRLQSDENSSVVREAFKKAIAADPFRVSPRQTWAEFEAGRLNAMPDVSAVSSNELMTGVDVACRSWMEADPLSAGPYRLRASVERRIWELTTEPAFLHRGIDSLSEAVLRHPGEVEVWLEKAELEAASGDRVASAASVARAAQLNELNHQWGHQDQYLSEKNEALLARLAESSTALDQHKSQEIPGMPAKAEQKLP